MESHGLKAVDLKFTTEGLEYLIDQYTREAGVRNLEREIAALCRKVARKIATARKKRTYEITPKTVHGFLGPVRYKELEIEQEPEVGVAMGLAWTEVGGEVLPVEATTMPGKGNLQLTGRLGDVMQESAKAALSYIRAHVAELGIAPDFYQKIDVHVHLPEGGIPKDGPSAGVAMITALVSALCDRPVRQDVAMTGEITLRGKVLKIGGLKEKAIAAHRAQVACVLIPHENEDDLSDVAPVVRSEIEFVPVRTIGDVLERALLPAGSEAKDPQRKKDPGGGRRRRPAPSSVPARAGQAGRTTGAMR